MLDNNGDINIKIILKEGTRLLANGNITITTVNYGLITIKNFQIWQSLNYNARLQQAINITPPTIRSRFGRFIQQVFFEDVQKWYLLEASICEEYLKVKKLNEVKKIGYEEVDIDEIPI